MCYVRKRFGEIGEGVFVYSVYLQTPFANRGKVRFHNSVDDVGFCDVRYCCIFFLSFSYTHTPTPCHLFFFCFYFYLSFNCHRPALQIRGSSFQRLTVPSLSWLPVQLSFLFQNGARDKLLMFLEFAFERNSFNLKLLLLSLFFYRVADFFFFSLSQIFPLSE